DPTDEARPGRPRDVQLVPGHANRIGGPGSDERKQPSADHPRRQPLEERAGAEEVFLDDALAVPPLGPDLLDRADAPPGPVVDHAPQEQLDAGLARMRAHASLPAPGMRLSTWRRSHRSQTSAGVPSGRMSSDTVTPTPSRARSRSSPARSVSAASRSW